MSKKLQPDFILLGRGLPKSIGLETAKRIRNLAPRSKILFVSQESPPDMVREALSPGMLLRLSVGP